MNEAQPRLLFPALKPLYIFLEPLSRPLIRCAAGGAWSRSRSGCGAAAPIRSIAG
jgi:hypothetical protein